MLIISDALSTAVGQTTFNVASVAFKGIIVDPVAPPIFKLLVPDPVTLGNGDPVAVAVSEHPEQSKVTVYLVVALAPTKDTLTPVIGCAAAAM
jgi:hypothetical protein